MFFELTYLREIVTNLQVRGLTIVGFGRGLPDLAAATKLWRDFAESPEVIYRDGYAH